MSATAAHPEPGKARGRKRAADPPPLLEAAAPAGDELWHYDSPAVLVSELVQFFSSLGVPEGPLMGQKWTLLPYQREALEALADPKVRRIIISVPRKAGKTAFAAGLLLAAVAGPLARRNSQVFSAARSRDQAALVHSLACKIIDQTPWLAAEAGYTETRKMIRGHRANAVYRALAADATRAHGLSPVLVIHDELGQVSGAQDDLYDALETATGAQARPKTVIISTQAADDQDLLSTLIDDAIASGDPRTRLILYAADRLDDPWDEATWRKCHPAYGLFTNTREFAEAADRAKRLPAAELSFRRYYLNQRIVGETGFCAPTVWKSNDGAPDIDIFRDGRPVYGGLDLSSRRDLTALVLATEGDDGQVHVLTRAWTPAATILERAQRDRAPYIAWRDMGLLVPIQGQSVDYGFVARDIAELTDGMALQAIAYDRWRIDEFKREMARLEIELPLEPCGQGYASMSPRIEIVLDLLLNARVNHGGNPVLTYATSSATITRDPAGNMKVDKSREHTRIDPLVAMVMAIGQMGLSIEQDFASVPIMVI